jgi:anhydro-N-acetylmuramic acid kinase
MAELYLGLMSGTSMDGVDAAVVDLGGACPRLLATASRPYAQSLRDSIAALANGCDDELAAFARLDGVLGRLFAETALDAIDRARLTARDITAIGSHGQTIRHYPVNDPPSTLQIGDPNIIASVTGITTVADFRRRDMSVGGQGAPLAPAFHEVLFRHRGKNRVILNLGGIANITILPADGRLPVRGFDTGPANTLMDRWAARHLKQPMDDQGRWAASGRVDRHLLGRMLADPYFSQPPPKSTGIDHFDLAWLDAHLRRGKARIPRKNVQATLCELTAITIVDAIRREAPKTSEVIACGGGVHNLALMFRLQVLLDEISLKSTEDFGFPPDWIEAMTFAWLAQQTLAGKPGNLPSVTGAQRPVILGGIYPGGRTGRARP